MTRQAADLDSEGESLWRVLEASWADQSKHDTFVRHCWSAGQLVAAGARYRAYIEVHPDDPIARSMQERLVMLSLQPLTARADAHPRSPFYASPWFLVVVGVAAVFGAALGIVYGGRP